MCDDGVYLHPVLVDGYFVFQCGGSSEGQFFLRQHFKWGTVEMATSTARNIIEGVMGGPPVVEAGKLSLWLEATIEWDEAQRWYTATNMAIERAIVMQQNA